MGVGGPIGIGSSSAAPMGVEERPAKVAGGGGGVVGSDERLDGLVRVAAGAGSRRPAEVVGGGGGAEAGDGARRRRRRLRQVRGGEGGGGGRGRTSAVAEAGAAGQRRQGRVARTTGRRHRVEPGEVRRRGVTGGKIRWGRWAIWAALGLSFPFKAH